jgi:hypothetical protein
VNPRYRQAGASTVTGQIEAVDSGGFTAVASTGDVDRDGERLLPGAFEPLPASIPCHLDHGMTASSVVAKATPYYDGDRLMIDAVFGSSPQAQEVRQTVREGLIDSVSVVVLGKQWEDRGGVRCLVSGELLACDLVSVPSNRQARVLEMRNVGAYRRTSRQGAVHPLVADALLLLARHEIQQAKAAGLYIDRRDAVRKITTDFLKGI